ncbi:MAG: acyl-CoA dehydrogenase family protein [Chitinophagales bacterium]|nr:acyl-CoA dehydrogenase family protein [Chitinophagales bacterium]
MAKELLKGGEFLIRDQAIEQIFTPEEYTEEQTMVRQMASDFFEKEVMARAHEIEKQEPGLTPSLLGRAGELGLLSTAIPAVYGGMEQDVITGCIICEEAGRTGSFATSFVCQIGIGTLPILYFGTEEQRKKYMPGLASGALKASYCLTEPTSGSDALGAKTTATLSEDGKEWILNGQKMWITNAGFADIYTVFAKIDGKDFTGFIVEKGTPGLTLGAEEDKMGIKGSSTRQVFFENCRIPVENLLGERGKGHKIAFNILNIGRYKLGATALGGAREVFNASVKYANERQQFNTPIGQFGAIQYKISEMAIKIFALEVATYRCAQDIGEQEQVFKAAGKDLSDSLLGAAEEYAIECAIVKIFGSEVLDYCVDENVQIHGGMGFSEELGVARAYRDSRIARIYEGTNEINRMLAVSQLLKNAMSGKLDIMSAAVAVSKELTAMPNLSTPEGSFGIEEKALKNAKKAILLVAGAAAQKLMAKLKDEQEIIMNVADMLIDVYVAESLLARVKKIYNTKGEAEAGVYVDILKVFFNDAVQRIAYNGREALMGFGEGDELSMMLVGLKRYTKYPTLNTKEARRRIARKALETNSYSF